MEHANFSEIHTHSREFKYEQKEKRTGCQTHRMCKNFSAFQLNKIDVKRIKNNIHKVCEIFARPVTYF